MSGWNSDAHGWARLRREDANGVSCAGARWTVPEVAAGAVAFFVHWELGLAFLGLKLWQQASGYRGNVFAFARDRWELLVGQARRLLGGTGLPFSVHVGARSSGSYAFDAWRQTELDRIDAEREKLRAAEREFASYREELLRAQDRDDFDKFMRDRRR